MPLYNTEKYLEKALKSIIHQTYQNLEIICVDDGSTDRCPEILREYASIDTRIRIITQKNEGIAKARDVGLHLSKGNWITFVDSDDWLDLDMYEKMISFGQENPADILACGYYLSYPDKEVEAINLDPLPAGIQDMKTFLYYVYCRDRYKGVASYLTNKMFRSSCVKKDSNLICFDHSLGCLGEDIDWAAKCFIQAKTIAYLPESLYHYRVRPESTFHSLDQRLQTLQHIQAYENIIALYTANEIEERVLNYVKRLYVYHLGVLIEYAQRTGRMEKIDILKEKAICYLPVYIKTNQDNPDRIKWITDLLG